MWPATCLHNHISPLTIAAKLINVLRRRALIIFYGYKDTVAQYFKGLYEGDTDLLSTVFHPDAELFGDVNDKFYYKTLADYLYSVANRKSPKDLGETLDMAILTIDVIGKVALVKTRVPMLGFNYIDFLSLVYKNDRWLIVGKTFVNV